MAFARTPSGTLSHQTMTVSHQWDEGSKKSKRVYLIWLFVIAILIPVIFDIGLFALPPYRLVLVFSIIPCGLLVLTGRLGKITIFDVLVVSFLLWVTVSIIKNHGVTSQYQFIGFTVLDTAGSYFLGRVLVRSARDFQVLVTAYFWSLVVMLPLAILETQTGDPIVMSTLQRFITTRMIVDHEIRFGLERAQVIFEHPILYGVYAASGLGIVAFTMSHQRSVSRTAFMCIIVAIAAVCSMSSIAFLVLSLQLMFIVYEMITRPNSWRWKILALLFIVSFVFVDALSNRTPFHVFISYLTLNSSSGFYRTFIFEFGIQNVANNPVFGLGLRDWARPRWMPPTVDNLWLLMAMRYGIPGFTLFAAIFVALVWKLSTVKLPPVKSAMRAGLLISLGGIIVSGVTVSFWAGVYVWIFFLVGSSVWLLDPKEQETTNTDTVPEEDSALVKRKIVYTRFPREGGLSSRS